MAKLSHSVSGNSPEDDNKRLQTGSLSLKKTVNTGDSKVTKSESDKILNQNSFELSEQNASQPESVAEWIYATLGSGVFEILKTNETTKLPFSSPEEISGKEWLLRALKTVFTEAQFAEIGREIYKTDQESKSGIKQKIEQEIEFKSSVLNKQIQNLTDQIEQNDSVRFQLEKQLQSALPIGKFIEIFFKPDNFESTFLKQLRVMLSEAAEHPQKETGEFTVKLGKGWSFVLNALTELIDDEKTNMEAVHKATYDLLESISETRIPERREILDLIAKIINEHFKEYEFVSPEQTLQIDPSIHDAQGKGTGQIKEGISFAVIRKGSRQAVKYAEIRV